MHCEVQRGFSELVSRLKKFRPKFNEGKEGVNDTVHRSVVSAVAAILVRV